MCRWFNTEFLFFLYYSQWALHSSTVKNKTKLSHTRRGLGFALVVNRRQEAYFAQVSFFYLLLVSFSQWGIGESVQVCVWALRGLWAGSACTPHSLDSEEVQWPSCFLRGEHASSDLFGFSFFLLFIRFGLNCGFVFVVFFLLFFCLSPTFLYIKIWIYLSVR